MLAPNSSMESSTGAIGSLIGTVATGVTSEPGLGGVDVPPADDDVDGNAPYRPVSAAMAEEAVEARLVSLKLTKLRYHVW